VGYATTLATSTARISNCNIGDSSVSFGSFKKSGFGKDMGPEQLQYFTRPKADWLTI
jgi:phenylacetaldehyde dehydrogenase